TDEPAIALGTHEPRRLHCGGAVGVLRGDLTAEFGPEAAFRARHRAAGLGDLRLELVHDLRPESAGTWRRNGHQLQGRLLFLEYHDRDGEGVVLLVVTLEAQLHVVHD